VTFQGDTTILTYPYYNYSGYPAHSGVNVVYSPSDGYITAVSTHGTWTSAGAWYSAPYGLTLDAYDSHGNLIAQSNGGGVYGANAFLSVSAPGIASVSFVGYASFFSLDDFTASGIKTVAPEPSTFALAGIGGLTLAGYLWRRRRAAAA
jgi:hypothetical protein